MATLYNVKTKEQVIELLRNGANINEEHPPTGPGFKSEDFSSMYTCLEYSCEAGNLSVLKGLFEHGLEGIPALKHRNINTFNYPINMAAYYGNLNIIKYLIEKGFDPRDIMHETTKRNNMDIIEYSIEIGLDINSVLTRAYPLDYENGRTVMNIACGYKQVDVIRKLLEHGAIVTNDDFLKACEYNIFDEKAKDIIAQLFIQGIDINYQDNNGHTGLHYLANSPNMAKSINFLISLGCNLNTQDNDGNTPLHFACMRGNIKNIKCIIENGANTNIENNDGFTPLHYAKTQEIKDLFKKN